MSIQKQKKGSNLYLYKKFADIVEDEIKSYTDSLKSKNKSYPNDEEIKQYKKQVITKSKNDSTYKNFIINPDMYTEYDWIREAIGDLTDLYSRFEML